MQAAFPWEAKSFSTVRQCTTKTDHKLERKGNRKKSKLAMEADDRKSSATELQNEEDDRKKRKVNKSKIHPDEVAVFPEFNLGAQPATPGAQTVRQGTYAPLASRYAHAVGISGGIHRAICRM